MAAAFEGDRADALYREAIERLARTRIRIELGRADTLGTPNWHSEPDASHSNVSVR